MRTEKARDAGEVMRLYSSLVGSAGCCWNEFYPSVEDVQADIDSGFLYVSRDEQGAVAVAAAMGDYPDLNELDVWSDDIKKPCEICRVGVRLDLQGRGLARDMLAFMENEARLSGFDGVRLLVNEKNLSAVRLYDRMNYACVGTARMYDLDWLCREKKLPG